MQYPEIRFRHGRRGIADPEKRSTVELEIYFLRKRKFISTGVRVRPREWDDVRGVVGCPDAVILNMRLTAFRRPYDEYVASLVVRGLPFSFADLDHALHGGGGSFVEFVASRVETRKDIRESTRRTHRKIVGTLKQFGQIATFADVTPANIRAFDAWLHDRYSRQTTIASYHKFLKIYIHQAIAMEQLDRDPYAGIKISRGKSTLRRYLTEEELAAIETLHPDDPALSRTRDLFLFQCYTGLAYADLAGFDFRDVRQRDGRYVVRQARRKTGEDFYIVLLSPALDILKKYGMRLPLVSNQKYNLALKALATCAGIRLNLTSHMGRHTFATWCLNHGVSLEQLARMLGHSDTKTTQIYARMVDHTLDDTFDRLEGCLSLRSR